MRRAVTLCLLVSASALLATAGASARGSESAVKPSLWLADASPLALRGSGFKPKEHVVVIVSAHRRVSRRIVASRGGTFELVFAGVASSNCSGFSATAVGNRGSRASYKRAPGQCAQP
jgi:hypothetical protein